MKLQLMKVPGLLTPNKTDPTDENVKSQTNQNDTQISDLVPSNQLQDL